MRAIKLLLKGIVPDKQEKVKLNKSISVIAVYLVGMLLAFPVLADRGERHYGDREGRFERRIDHGWETGELTRRELRKLERKLGKIDRLKHEFWEDGRLSRHERRILREKRDRLSHAIYRMKHNDRRARFRQRNRFEDRHFSFDYYDG